MTSEALPYKYSISEVTTIKLSFEEDVELYARHGVPGIGVWGFKVDPVGMERAGDLLRRHSLHATNCIPDLNSILPYVLSPEPADPDRRIEAFLSNMERMAKLNPDAIVVITGPLGGRSREEAFDLCVYGFRRIARAAQDLGVTLAFEPIHRSEAEVFTFISDIPQSLELARAVDSPNFKLLFDTWHLWDTDNVHEHIRNHIDMIAGVHVADWQHNTRTWADRAFPGEGKVPMRELLRTIQEAGFSGYYDVELFSDDGRYDADYPDSIWKLPPDEIVERATHIFRTS